MSRLPNTLILGIRRVAIVIRYVTLLYGLGYIYNTHCNIRQVENTLAQIFIKSSPLHNLKYCITYLNQI